MVVDNQIRILRERDLNQISALAALIKTSSVSEAAQLLQITQPAMSKALDRLRRELGDQLLVRSGNRMVPTPRAQELAPLLDDLLDRLKGVYEPSSSFDIARARRTVRIASNDHIQHVMGPGIVRLIRDKAPSLTVQLRPVGLLQQQPEQLLIEGVVDLAIGAAATSPHLRSELLYREKFVCLACPKNKKLPGVLDLDGFCAQPQLDVSPSGTGLLPHMLDAFMSEHKRKRQVVAMISSYLAVPSFIAGTDMISLVPYKSLPLLLPGSYRIVKLAFQPPHYDIALWWHNSTHGDPLFRWLRKEIVAVAQTLA